MAMTITAEKTADSQGADGAYAKWQQTVAARYADRSFVARNRSGVELDPVYSGLDRNGNEAEMPGQYPYENTGIKRGHSLAGTPGLKRG